MDKKIQNVKDIKWIKIKPIADDIYIAPVLITDSKKQKPGIYLLIYLIVNKKLKVGSIYKDENNIDYRCTDDNKLTSISLYTFTTYQLPNRIMLSKPYFKDI